MGNGRCTSMIAPIHAWKAASWQCCPLMSANATASCEESVNGTWVILTRGKIISQKTMMISEPMAGAKGLAFSDCQQTKDTAADEFDARSQLVEGDQILGSHCDHAYPVPSFRSTWNRNLCSMKARTRR